MAQRGEDLDIKQLFRVIFIQGGQVAVGTAIGLGVLLLVGIVGVLTAPLWLPIVAFVYWRREKKAKAAAGQDVSDLAAGGAGGGEAPSSPV